MHSVNQHMGRRFTQITELERYSHYEMKGSMMKNEVN